MLGTMSTPPIDIRRLDAILEQRRRNFVLKLEKDDPELATKVKEADARQGQETHEVDAMGGG